MLHALGVDPEAEALYVVLGPMESATVGELAALCATDNSQIERQLGALRDIGLALEMPSGQWQPIPLQEVVKGLRTQRLAEIESAMVSAEAMQSKLLAATEFRSDTARTVRTVVGREAIIAVRQEICRSAKVELCGFDKPPYTVGSQPSEADLNEMSPEWEALERGVPVRSVYHPGFDADRLRELALFTVHGEQARMGAVPMKLLLVDSRLALIPSMKSYTPGHELRASLIRHPMLVEALQWLFETVWDNSVSVVATTMTEGDDPRRDMLISLLMAGSTDATIATQLGVNERSVRRWVSDLMEELGVRTRLQLGAALVRSETLRHDHSRLS